MITACVLVEMSNKKEFDINLRTYEEKLVFYEAPSFCLR